VPVEVESDALSRFARFSFVNKSSVRRRRRRLSESYRLRVRLSESYHGREDTRSSLIASFSLSFDDKRHTEGRRSVVTLHFVTSRVHDDRY